MNLREAVSNDTEIKLGLYSLVKDVYTGVVGFRDGKKLHRQLNNLARTDGLVVAIIKHLFDQNNFMDEYSRVTEDFIFKLSRENKQLTLQNESLRRRLNTKDSN